DIDPGEHLRQIYTASGFSTINTSALTGQGTERLLELMGNKVCVFTGNSGVGKSSLLNCLDPDFSIRTGALSKKIGRGRQTTRHTELFKLKSGALIADTPGFSSFDIESSELMTTTALQYAFIDIRPHIGYCRYVGCSHTKERGCAVLKAVEDGTISKSRFESYLRLYESAKSIHEWELKKKDT
ncbi:MAG: ribosome small subunit-dependent GTPase A, partial [Clostridiales bacterium]|nr:ribosome small subunit-dependent GTPase A [Clostridiales bacterium]